MRRRPERRPRPARRTPARCPRAAAARPCRREAAPWARGWRRPAPPQRDGPRLQLARVVEQPVELDVDRHQRLLSLGFELHDQVVYERLAGPWVRSPYPIGRPSPPGRAAWNAARSAGSSRSTKDAPAGSTRRHSGSSTTLVRSAPSRARNDRSAPASSNALTAASAAERW